jgi:hypothetical protein
MSPSFFFLLTLAVTTLVLLLQIIGDRMRGRALRELAAEWQMHYSRSDRFKLGDRVAEMLPIPGAARVRISDLIYGNEDDGYRYFFRATFTEGVVRGKRRQVRVATFRESRQPGAASALEIRLATEGMSILDQYRELRTLIVDSR